MLFLKTSISYKDIEIVDSLIFSLHQNQVCLFFIQGLMNGKISGSMGILHVYFLYYFIVNFLKPKIDRTAMLIDTDVITPFEDKAL